MGDLNTNVNKAARENAVLTWFCYRQPHLCLYFTYIFDEIAMADAASGSVDRSVQVKLVLLGKLSQLLTMPMSTIHTRYQFGPLMLELTHIYR